MKYIEENKKMYEMLQNGYTFREIGESFGITKQAAHERITYYKRKIEGIRGHNFNINKIVYQGIYDWFNERYDESLSSLVNIVYGHHDACTITKFSGFLTGKHDTYLKIEQIKRLCEVIGKPFEEVFKRRDAE